MSIINDALKKAQRQRNQDPSQVVPPMPGGGGSAAPRGRTRPGNALWLIGGGALALVVVSVVLTIFLVNRPAAKPASSLAANSVAAPKQVAAVVVAPALAPAQPAPAPAMTSTPPGAIAPASIVTAGRSGAAPTPAPPAVRGPESAVAEKQTPPAAAAAGVEAPSTNPKGDDRIHAFVDTVRVTGIRSSGNDSRVLMNEKVFRVNDLVDRILGIRLIKVEADSLTFSDANGVTYVKYF